MASSSSQTPLLQVLHLDDDPFELERIKTALEQNAVDCRFQVSSASQVAEYRAKLKQQPHVVILDVHIGDPDDSGVSLASVTRQTSPSTVILMCSTADDVTTITECLHAGADDFLSKQSDKAELSLRVYNSYRLARLKQGGDSSPTSQAHKPAIGTTMERISKRVPLIIDSAITAVFIRGESGTGKEVVADLFHQQIPNGTPFVKVNCGAIAPSLLESELFGHVKGAFTGAAADKRGLFEAASGGWIFLDEVATLSPSAQVALLRVLENQEVLRVGATKPVSISVRVLSATNEPLEQLSRDGKFRADLWQRLREAEISIPPLRDRPKEIKALVEHFCRSMVGGPYTVSGPVLEVLANFSWSEGNVRELRNCLRAMTEMHVNKLLTPLSIPARIWDELGEKPSDKQDAKPDIKKAAKLTDKPLDQPKAGTSATETSINLPWKPEDPELSYDRMADYLLIEMTRRLAKDRGKQSLRGLAQAIGVSRSTLSGRLKDIVQNQLIDLSELTRYVSVSDR